MEQLCLNEDLIRLRNEGVGYSLVGGCHLVIDGIPYLNRQKVLSTGQLVMRLRTSGRNILPPDDHTAHWVGEIPANMDGSLIQGLLQPCASQNINLGNGVVANYFLSCKQIDVTGRPIADTNHYDKVMRYITVISTPAKHLYPEECEKLVKPIIIQKDDSPFVYGDTNSSRAGVLSISQRLENQRIAIIGMGGTGSYLLEFLAKCPVKEIHIFDDDYFDTHNAFRCPGAATVEQLDSRPTKVEYLSSIYSKMHKGIVSHCVRVTEANMNLLDDMDFVFLSVDSVAARLSIANYLIDLKKPFIDSGLGLDINQDRVVGQVRVTTGLYGNYDHLKDAFGSIQLDDDLYKSNIQVAELNALAAILSVTKWKRMMEFYGDASSKGDLDIAYSVSDNVIIHSNHVGDE